MGKSNRGHHLTKCSHVWHYQRRRPKAYEDVEPRQRIRFSLHTPDFTEAKLLAAQHSLNLERQWRLAMELGVSLGSNDTVRRHDAAVEIARDFGLSYVAATALDDIALLKRIKLLTAVDPKPAEQKALLGLVEVPELTLMQAFERFWEHILDERRALSQDQQRVKRNVFLKSIRNFETANGAVALHDLKREHALIFRTWWMARIEAEGLKPYTANREINSLRRLISVNFDIDSVERVNPFARVRLKDTIEQTRKPFSTEFIQGDLLAPGALSSLPEPLQVLVRLLINTSMRPSEAVGLELSDITVETEVPHVYVRRNGTRSLKTDHSKRMLLLLGVSLDAARDLVAMGGWGKWAGKNMYATTLINRRFRESNLVPDRNQSLYSLRHWFQDQLTKRDVVDRAQAQLMGHKFQRPKYGLGKDLAELREIVEPFAIP